MRKKSYVLVLVMLLLMCSMLFLIGCDNTIDDDDDDDGSLTMIEMLTNVGTALSNSLKANPSNQMKIDVEAALSTQDDKKVDASSYVLKVQSNINLGTNEGENGMVISIDDVLNNKSLLKISCDNENIYFQAGTSKYKITNATLFDAIKNITGTVPNGDLDTSMLDVVFYFIGECAFTDGVVNEAKTEYTFKFSLSKFLTSETLWGIFDSIAGMDETIYGLFGASNREEFVANIPNCTADVKFTIANDKLKNIVTSEGSYEKSGFKFALNKFDFSNGKIDALAVVPENIDGYIVTKIGSFRMAGNIDFLSDGNSYITYDWKVESNLDLLLLAKANFDFSQLPEDNFFHFRLSHKCVTGGCNEYCQSKYALGDGAIIDIGFSPRDFGTSNINIAIGMYNLLGKDIIKMLAPGYEDIITLALPAHVLLSFDTADFQYTDTPFTNGSQSVAELDGIMATISQLLGALKSVSLDANNKAINIDVPTLLSAFALGSDVTGTLNSILGSSNYNFDSVRMDLDMSVFADHQFIDSYDVYTETVYKKGNNISGVKNYSAIASGTSVVSGGPAIGWEVAKFEKDGTTPLNDEGILPIYEFYKKPYQGVDTVLYDKDMKITPAELNALIGRGKIAYSVTSYKKTKLKGRGVITGIDNIDYSLIGKKQTVRFITELPSGWLGSAVMDALPIDVNSFLKASVEGTIILSAESDFAYTTHLSESKTYVMGEPIPRGIEATFKRDGVAENVTANGWSNTFVWSNHSNCYVAGAVGTYDMVYEIGGRTIIEKINVVAPDSYTVEFGGQESLDLVLTSMLNPKKNDMLLNYGSVTFKTGDKSYTIQLGYGDYTFPTYGVVKTDYSDILSGSTTYGIYFNEVDKDLRMTINLYGVATCERSIEIKDIPTQYSYDHDSWTLKRNKISTTNNKINVNEKTDMMAMLKFDYYGNKGIDNVTYVLELTKKNVTGRYVAVFEDEYTDTLNGKTANLPAYTPVRGILQNFQITVKTEGEIKITVKTIGADGKTIATDFVELTAVYSQPFRTFNGDMVVGDEKNTGTLKIYQVKESAKVSKNVVIVLNSISRIGENGKPTAESFPVTLFEVVFDYNDVDFTKDGTSKDGSRIDINFTVNRFSSKFVDGKYKILMSMYDADTGRSIGDLGFAANNAFIIDLAR